MPVFCPKPPLKALVWLGYALVGGCLLPPLAPEASGSLGTPSQGVLLKGASLPDQGEGFVRARPDDPTRWATPRLVHALERAAAVVAQDFVLTAPVRVGDLSSVSGGMHPRHGSHRSGRDVDVIFYLTDAQGRSVHGRGWLAFSRFGLVKERRGSRRASGSGDWFFFDDARNWHLVRTLLLDPTIEVQWIFCSYGLKQRLLNYAILHEPNKEVIFRATWVLHRPSRARAHDDHFHVRIMCSAEERVLGCVDQAPLWPWLRRKPDTLNWRAEPVLGDKELVDELMQGLGPSSL